MNIIMYLDNLTPQSTGIGANIVNEFKLSGVSVIIYYHVCFLE